jgi:hypothetical protein
MVKLKINKILDNNHKVSIKKKIFYQAKNIKPPNKMMEQEHSIKVSINKIHNQKLLKNIVWSMVYSKEMMLFEFKKNSPRKNDIYSQKINK